MSLCDYSAFAPWSAPDPRTTLARVTDLLVLVGLAAAVAGALGGFLWLAARVRRSGVGAQLMGPIDQLYRPAAYQFHQESRLGEQCERIDSRTATKPDGAPHTTVVFARHRAG